MAKSVLLNLNFIFLFFSTSNAIDWYDCNSVFDKITKISKESAEISAELDNLKDEVESKKSDLDSKKNDYEDCLQYPDTYDLMNDGCSSNESDYQDSLDEYNNMVEEYNSKTDELNDMLYKLKKTLKKLENITGYTF